MTLISPVGQLMDEHRLIEGVLGAMEVQVSRMKSGPFPAEFFSSALDFFATFADGCHHYKEEQALFPALQNRGVPRNGGPIGCMLKEHDQGRACLAGIRKNLEAAGTGSAEAAGAIARHATEYIELLRQHIFKEDNVLFPMAQQLLDADSAAALEEEFSREDNPKTARALRERYAALAAELIAAAPPQPCAR